MKRIRSIMPKALTAYTLRQPGDTEDKPKQSPLEKPKTRKKPIAKQTSFFYPSNV